MNIYAGLLFDQGFIHDAQLAMTLAGAGEVPVPKAGQRSARTLKPARVGGPSASRTPFKPSGFYTACCVALRPFR